MTFRLPSLALTIMLAMWLVGCASGPSSTRPHVLSMVNRDVAALSAHDVAVCMRQAGFSDEQILEAGPTLRNALATAGSAQLRVGKHVQAIFAVDGDHLYVSSRQRGTFIHPLTVDAQHQPTHTAPRHSP